MNLIPTPSLLVFVSLFFSCGPRDSVKSTDSDKDNEISLAAIYSSYFPVGVSIGPANLNRGQEKDLIVQQFSSLTAENVMKMGPIHPRADSFYWESADQIVDFARKHSMKMRGHALIWHQQYPDWFFQDAEGNQISKDTLYSRMENHITTVVKRYKGTIYAWDVVNEAVSDNPGEIHRKESPFYKIAGDEYLGKAFQLAHEADPDARLFYNDYNAAIPEKVDRIYELVKGLLDKGIPVHGIGIQGHWSIYGPSRNDLEYAISKYSSLGVEVQITELDISIYKWEKAMRELREGESDDFTADLQVKQANTYEMIFEVFRENNDVITGVTFWNISDKHTWLDNYPVPGRKNYPLLFDQDYRPKESFYKVIEFENNE